MPSDRPSFLRRVIPFVLQTLAWFPTRVAFSFFVHFEVYGREKLSGIHQAIFAANHASELDPIVVTAALNPFGRFAPLFYAAAPQKEFKNNPNVRWRQHIYRPSFFRAWGAYPIVRGVHDYAKSLAAHSNLLKAGESICIFPEGGITKTGELGEPRGGVIHLAQETGVPIVPVAITGTYKMTGRLFFSRKRHITVEFGEPVCPQEMAVSSPEEYRREASRIFSAIFSMRERHKAFGYRVSKRVRVAYALVRSIFGPCVRGIWVRRVVGRENLPRTGPLLIAANHQSYFDFITTIAIAPRNIYYLAAEKFFRKRLWRFFMKITGQIQVDREHKENRKNLDRTVYDLLQAGHAIGIFPEGTRAPSREKMLEGYPGIIRYAFATGTPIVPIGIRGAYDVMSRFDRRPRFKKSIELHIGEPITFPDALTSEPSPEHIRAELKKLMRKIAALADKDYPYGD